VSKKHGERLNLDISTTEKGYQGNWSPSMSAEYCWTLRNVSQANHSRKSSTVTLYVMYILSVIKCKYRVSSNFYRALENLPDAKKTNVFEFNAKKTLLGLPALLRVK
jgi:hypothetical protein